MPALFDCYMGRRSTGQLPPYALRLARGDFERGRVSSRTHRPGLLGHGDVMRGRGRTFVVAVVHDQDGGVPWENEDGHGPVTDWTSRAKNPGELVLCETRQGKRYYDFREACAIAKRDGWDAKPYSTTETAKQKAAKAARADYEYLRRFCADQWHYVGVCLFELPRDGMARDAESIAESAPFGVLKHWALWGIESDSPAYHDEVARELFREALHDG